jgi:hypothetical protein
MNIETAVYVFLLSSCFVLIDNRRNINIMGGCFVGSAAAFQAGPDAISKAYDKDLEYEQRVCRFLEQTKGDSEYEEKVRKFLEETARW